MLHAVQDLQVLPGGLLFRSNFSLQLSLCIYFCCPAEQQERSTSPEMSAAEIDAILDSFEIQSEGPGGPYCGPPCAPNATPTPTFAREDVRTGAVQLVSKDFF